jgi:hypothetical protein
MNQNKTYNIFISNIVPESVITDVDDFSFAAQYYQEKVAVIFPFDKVISIVFTKHTLGLERNNNFIFFIYKNKNKLLNIFKSLWGILKIVPFQSNIVFYNLSYRTFLLLRCLKFFKKCSCYVIVADYTQITSKKSFVSKLFQASINSAIHKSDGTLVLNSNIRVNSNTICQEAIVLDDWYDEKVMAENPIEPFSILFSGSIGSTTGVEVAIDAMRLLNEYTLYITGRLFDIDEEYLISYIANNSKGNVLYLGKLDKEAYLQRLARSEFALSLRDSNNIDHKFNFPSKITEYLSFNKKVISTINYTAVSDLIFYSDFTPESVSKQILIAKNKVILYRELVLKRFGKDLFSNKLNKLMQQNL